MLGQGPGRLMPQAVAAATASDAGLAFSDTFDEVADATVHEPTLGDLAGGGDCGEAQEPPALAETVLLFPIALPLISDPAAAATEASCFRAILTGPKLGSDGALPKLSALFAMADRTEGEAVTLPAASDGREHPAQTLAEVSGTSGLPERPAGRSVEDLTVPVGSFAQSPAPVPTSKGRVPAQPLDAAPQVGAPHQLLPQSPARDSPVPDAPSTPPIEKPTTREEEAAKSRQLEVAAPPRAAPPPDRLLPTGVTDPAGLTDLTAATNKERREASSAFVDQGLIPKGAETAGRSTPDAGRGPDGRADGQGRLTGLASREGKDALPRPAVARPVPNLATPLLDDARPVPDPVLVWPVGLPDGGLSSGPEPIGRHPLSPSDLGAQVIARSPHGIGMQLADKMPATAGQPVEITLAPEELGKVRMTIWATDGGLTLQLVADRPETLDLMRRHIDQLAQDFRDMGFERLSFSFGREEPENQQSGQAAPADLPEEEPAQPVVIPAAGPSLRSAPVVPLMPDDRLDLRI